MRFRRLRIAWSVGEGLLAVLLIVTWVRSYGYRDSFRCRVLVPMVMFYSQRGQCVLTVTNSDGPSNQRWGWHSSQITAGDIQFWKQQFEKYGNGIGFTAVRTGRGLT